MCCRASQRAHCDNNNGCEGPGPWGRCRGTALGKLRKVVMHTWLCDDTSSDGGSSRERRSSEQDWSLRRLRRCAAAQALGVEQLAALLRCGLPLQE